MNNLMLEFRRIVNEARDNTLSPVLIRNQLKEYLHYFVLDFIYNSEFKDMIFYGGSCLRILYDLPRMSEDLDFEAEQDISLGKLAKSLEEYFSKGLKLQEKFSINKTKSINRIFLSFPVMFGLGLSTHKEETLKIKVEVRPVTRAYLKKLKPILSLKSSFGKSFVIKHYDLPTLFASKLAAIVDRPKKGFHIGQLSDGINFKGRDFFDLIWYMERGVLPNENMLKLNGIDKSIREVFDEISIFITKTDIRVGLKKDLEPLFVSQVFVDNFVNDFKAVFDNFKQRNYPGS